ncbi:MAG: hypothetical protein R3Y04_09510 [Rikenellaceae bacterium]
MCKKHFLYLIAFFLLFSCEMDSSSGDEVFTPTLTFSAETSLQIDASETTQTVAFTTNTDWSVELTDGDSEDAPDWLTVTPMSGS